MALWPVLPFDTTHLTYSNSAQDPIQMTWFLAWTPFALFHLHNPFFTTYLDFPQGVNLATNTAVMPVAFLASAITLGLGPIAGLNFSLYLALVGSALSMFLVLRSWVRWWPAAFAGALLFGFGSYMQSEAQIHLDLSFMVLPPIFFWLLAEEVLRRRWRPGPAGMFLGLVIALQFLINAEILTDMTIMGLVGLVAVGVVHRRVVRERAREVATFLLAAAAAALILLSYPLWMFLAGPQHLHKPFEGVAASQSYRDDLLDPFLRNVDVVRYRVGRPAVLWTTGSQFLGVPMVCLLVLLTGTWRRRLGVWLPALLALVAFVLSLGPSLSVDGNSTGVPLPGALFEHVSVLDNVLPARWAAMTWLFVAILIAVGLDNTYRWLGKLLADRPAKRRSGSHVANPAVHGGWAALILVVVCVVAFWPVLSRMRMTQTPVLSFPGPGNAVSTSLAAHTPSGGTVLVLPRLKQNDDLPMLWQADAKMHYRLVQGYAIVPNPTSRYQLGVAPLQ